MCINHEKAGKITQCLRFNATFSSDVINVFPKFFFTFCSQSYLFGLYWGLAAVPHQREVDQSSSGHLEAFC